MTTSGIQMRQTAALAIAILIVVAIAILALSGFFSDNADCRIEEHLSPESGTVATIPNCEP